MRGRGIEVRRALPVLPPLPGRTRIDAESKPSLRTLAGARDLLPLSAADPQRYPGLLESAASGASARYDILFAFPDAWFALERDGRVRDAAGTVRGTRFLGELDAQWRAAAGHAARSGGAAADPPLPFRGGWLLFLSYELAGEVEPTLRCLPDAADSFLPVALAVRCPAAIIVDRVLDCVHLVAERGHESAIDAMHADLARGGTWSAQAAAASAVDEDDPQRYLGGVAAIHEHLRAGEVFQVNFSREWRAHVGAGTTAAAVYDNLRRANPAPFAGLLQWQDWAIASSSPERLVDTRGRCVATRPIAGTRPRLAGDDDVAQRRELIAHPKERAEHVMLIDLGRNDLGRVCVPGSVAVDELMTLESYAHVHHIVSNVRGTLRSGVTPGDVIRAVFPGGTITGCPKVRTMQLIGELEGCGRGAYTGALGYLNLDGDLDLNILIRSLTMRAGALRLRAGAGIVADSVAARELDETRAKARGLLRALGIER